MELLNSTSNSDEAKNNVLLLEEVTRLTSLDGIQLHLRSWLPPFSPDKVVVIVHGLGGHSGYYATSAAPYLVPAGAAIYASDLRGHGLSDGLRGDIDSFAHFHRDIAATIRFARLKHPGLPLFLMAESMGTSIAINYVAQSSAEIQPDALILVACVIAPTVTPSVREVARTLWYLSTNRQKPALPITGREELGIRDHEFIKVLKSDSLFNKRISVRFLSSMTGHMQQAARNHGALKLPVLLMQGGCDYTIRHRPTRAFFRRIASSDKEMHVFPNAYHALLNDPDAPEVRERLLSWLERQSQKLAKGI